LTEEGYNKRRKEERGKRKEEREERREDGEHTYMHVELSKENDSILTPPFSFLSPQKKQN
jgi:hypothetical protein